MSHILLVDAGETQQRTVLHSYLQEDQTPQLWISLYYVDGYHFQVLLFEILGQDNAIVSFVLWICQNLYASA